MLKVFNGPKYDEKTALERSRGLLEAFKKRRTIRNFEPEEIDSEIVLNAIRAAGLAPSGANKQPWSFVLIKDPELKEKIRFVAEGNETDFYHRKVSKKWLSDLEPLHTNEIKSFLTDASYLIAVFSKPYEKKSGVKNFNYYSTESVGIATGFLISVLHLSGLSVLTYTPTQMYFLKTILNRHKHEKPFMLLAVGKAKCDAKVPMITKKNLKSILTIF